MHPILVRFRRQVIAGVLLAMAASVIGAFDRPASTVVFLGAAICYGSANNAILYRAE